MDKEGFYAINRALAEAGIAGRVAPVPYEDSHSPGVDIYTRSAVTTEEVRAALGEAGLLHSIAPQNADAEGHENSTLPSLYPGSAYYESCGCDDCPGTARHTFEDRNLPEDKD